MSKSLSSSSSKSGDHAKRNLFQPKTQALIEHKGYRVRRKLGEGAFGVVYLATYARTGMPAAVKVIDLGAMSDRTRTKFLPRELETLIRSRHVNLISVYDIFRADGKMFIFMEYAANGDIKRYQRRAGEIVEPLAAQWFEQATAGLAFLHDTLRTAHRDIKLDNILLNDRWIAKLTDFGFAKRSYDCAKNRAVMSETFCGTKRYECPQILLRQRYDAFKADIWSMGVTLFVMLHREFPFYDKDPKRMAAQQMDYPDHMRSKYVRKDLADDAVELLEATLHPDEPMRCSAKEILQNEWLRRKRNVKVKIPSNLAATPENKESDKIQGDIDK